MFDLKKYYLAQERSKWKRFKIKQGLSRPPVDYLARDIDDFVSNKTSITLGKTIMLPQVYFFKNEESDFEAFSLTLRDGSGDLDVWARYTALNAHSDNFSSEAFLHNALNKLKDSNLYFPIIQKGMILPFVDDNEDNRIYLIGFTDTGTPKPKFNLSTIFSSVGFVPAKTYAPVFSFVK